MNTTVKLQTKVKNFSLANTTSINYGISATLVSLAAGTIAYLSYKLSSIDLSNLKFPIF
ncbi:MAG: hypothetical protein IH840_18470 [Candidatus Heimdallarchaeota archaeon]|nr:hypothetical protein [Candidatus Heimdallarchaeota archaeon]